MIRLFLAALALLMGAQANAAPTRQCGIVAATPQTAEWSPAKIEAFLTPTITQMMREKGIVGGVATVVKDGVPIYTHGFGKSDAKRGTVIDADRSLFQIGSVTKVMTAIAALKQVEAGKLSLTADISLRPNMAMYHGRSGPITLANLLTHTAGFEEAGPNFYANAPFSKRPPIGPFLAANRPAIVYPTGKIRAYSNFGASLVAQLVEQSSGQPFDRYLNAHIFGPLSMASTTASYPLPKGFSERAVAGYDGTAFVEAEYHRAIGAGEVLTTAPDMAKFMAAFLEPNTVIPQAMVNDMSAPHFQEVPCANALGWMVWLENRRGARMVTHGGSVTGSVSNMMLFPEHGIGVFYAFNSSDYSAIDTIEDAIVDRWFPAPKSSPVKALLPAAGEYHGSRIGVENFGRFARLFGDAVANLRHGPNNTLLFKGEVWNQRAAGIFESQKGGKTLVTFMRDGQPAFIERGTQSFVKARFFERSDVQLSILGLCLFSLLASLLLWAFARFKSPVSRWVRLLPMASFAIALGVLGAIASVGTEQSVWLFGVPSQVRIAVVAAYVLWPLAIAAVGLAAATWRLEPLRINRITHMVSASAALGLALWFSHWNLIGSTF